MITDDGYFGPDSVSWRVHREVTVPLVVKVVKESAEA